MNLKQQLNKLKREQYHGETVKDFCFALCLSTKTYYEIMQGRRDKNNLRVIRTDHKLKEWINALLTKNG